MARRKATSSDSTARHHERLIVRRARPEDREAIFAMSEGIWGGQDYLPLIWDKWLADRKGVLLTATLHGKPVGSSKVTIIAPGEVWLEGLRLHPDHQGRGLSHQLDRATCREAMKLKPKSVRYSTWVGNAPAHHLAEARGFWQVARTEWLWGKAGRRRELSTRLATPPEIDDVARFVRESECYARTSGLQGVGWTFHALTRRRMRRLISKGRVLVSPRRGTISAVGIWDLDHVGGDVCLGFVDGPDDAVSLLARDVLETARDLGREVASATVPEGRIADLVHRAGFDFTQPFCGAVYELGPRGFHGDEEPLRELLDRTLRTNETQAADLLVEFLAGKVPRRLAPENVRDFVMRYMLKDPRRLCYGSIREFYHGLPTLDLRAIALAIVEHFCADHGLAADAMRVGKTSIAFRYRGKRLATLRRVRRSLELSLGPGFGACFPPNVDLRAEALNLDSGSLDRATGCYSAVTLKLTEQAHIAGAVKAIDIIMRAASRTR